MARKKLDYSFAEKYDTRRSPAWRYERTQRLLGSNNPPHPHRDDQCVRDLRLYYIAKRRYREVVDDETELQKILGASFQHVWAADRIFFGGRSDRARYGVEAMLLAGQTDGEIAAAVSSTPEAISFYERAFFNVRDRLSNYNYIASGVLMDAFMSGLGNRSPEMTAKYFGYFGGPVVLRIILDGFDIAEPRPTEPADVIPWFDKIYRRFARVVANVGLGFMEPSNFNIRTLVEGYQSLLSLDYREAATRGEDNPIRQALSTFITRYPLHKGDAADKLPHRPGELYGDGHVEPRVRELHAISSGGTVDALKVYNVKNWKPDSDDGQTGV